MSLYEDIPPVGSTGSSSSSNSGGSGANDKAPSKKTAPPPALLRKRNTPAASKPPPPPPPAAAAAAAAAVVVVVEEQPLPTPVATVLAPEDTYDPMKPNKHEENPAFKRRKPGAAAANSHIGKALLEKAGWTDGHSLGKNNVGIVRPIVLGTERLTSLLRSRVVLIRNAVGAGDVDEDFQPEMAQECAKHGAVVDMVVWEVPEAQLHTVDPRDHVRVLVEFDSVEAADRCRGALHERWFAQRQLEAVSYPEEDFKAKKYRQ